VDGQIYPKPDADMNLRLETTSILNYLERRNYLKEVSWLPADFQIKNMQLTLGYEPAYQYMAGTPNYFFANLNMEKPLNIDGYDVLLQTSTYRHMDSKENITYEFEVRGVQYRLVLEQLSPPRNAGVGSK
jgi:hypothetical protein